MMWWIGLAPCEFEFLFPGSLTFTLHAGHVFIGVGLRTDLQPARVPLGPEGLRWLLGTLKSPCSDYEFVRALAGIRRLVVHINAIEKYDLISLCNPRACPWGQEAFAGYLEPPALRQRPHRFFRFLICTGARRSSATCGTNRKKAFSWLLGTISPHTAIEPILNLYWRLPESGDLWCKSTQLKKDDLMSR
jgi:hypothetical protein